MAKKKQKYRKNPPAPMLITRFVNQNKIAIREQMAVEAFAKGFATKNHYNTLMDMYGLLVAAQHLDKAKVEMAGQVASIISQHLLTIKDRYERTDKLGCSGEELTAIKKFAFKFEEFWHMQSGDFYLKCEDKLQEFYTLNRGKKQTQMKGEEHGESLNTSE